MLKAGVVFLVMLGWAGSVWAQDSPSAGAAGTACRSNLDCDARSYCAFPVGACGGPGFCEIRPEVCPHFLDPVCGCDHHTYGNACEAAAHGESILHGGACCESGSLCDDGHPWTCNDVCIDGICRGTPTSFGDCDCDFDVDLADFSHFQMCFNGPNRPPTRSYEDSCRRVDRDADGDVDLADFEAFQECYNGPNRPAACPLLPRLAGYDRSDCLPGGSDLGESPYPGCGEEVVEVVVVGRDLHVTHRNAAYNCCLDEIRVTFENQGSLLRLSETEVAPMPCHCMCCYDVKATVADLWPGIYTLEYCWFDYETHGPMCITQIVVVP